MTSTVPVPAAAPTPIIFDPAHPDLSALAWNPTYSEARSQLMTDLYGHRYDGVQMKTISLPQTWPRWATLVSTLVPGVLALCGIALLVTGTPLGQFFSTGFFVVAGFLALIGLGIYSLIHYVGRMGAGGYRRVKLERLAADNGLIYRQRAVPPPFPGCIFTTDTRDPYVFEDFSTATPQPINFGNYHPVSVSPDGPAAQIAPSPGLSWGFLAIQLERPLPGLLLVSQTRQDGDVSLPIRPNPSQRLSLEGDFDKYFTLYCAKEHEQDALYVITPDLMALLIDRATPFDVEIVDDWMFFYSRIPFDLLDETVCRRLFDILQTIGGKVVRQASRYETTTPAIAQPAEPAEHLATPGRGRSGVRTAITIVIAAIVTAAASIVVWFAVQSLVR